MMYKVQFLPVAKNDLTEIAGYISAELNAPDAALKLAEKIVQGTQRLSEFPYSYHVYTPIRPLTQEYRRLRVENYLVFYCVDEAEKTVTVMRIIYAKRDFEKLI